MLLPLLLTAPALAFVVDLQVDPHPIGRVEGRTAAQVDLPSVVLAHKDPLRLLGRRGGALRSLAGWSCVVPLSDGTGMLGETLDDCRQLYALPPGASADFVHQVPPGDATILRMAVAPADPAGTVIIAQDGALFLGGELGAVVAASIYVGGRWLPAAVDVPTRTLQLPGEARAAVDAWMAAGQGELVVRAEIEGAPREKEWRAAPVWLSQAERAEAAQVQEEAAAEWCVPGARPAALQRTFLVCMDAEAGTVRTRRFDERGAELDEGTHALPTGTYIEVAVRHPVDARVQVELADALGHSAGEELLAPLPAAGAVRRTVSRRLFAPREAGPVQLTARAGGAVVAAEEVEVVDRYLGAIRLGVAVTSPAHRSYELGEVNDAGTAAVERVSADVLDGEVVAAFSPFLERGGRDYLVSAPVRFAPTVGLGLMAVNGGSVRFTLFQSFYLGGEVELSPLFAVGLAGTLRRVGRLAPGVEEGDLRDPEDEVPTVGAFRPGLALTVGFTPGAFRLRSPVR
ncbi:hypothetical protein L6R53_17500 [Myxococcota bacterium]|nr:hypothetical protein [Myxococcota bacterium]